jgi:hypothetical protein
MARKYPNTLHGFSTLLATRPLLEDYDPNLLVLAAEYLEVHHEDIAQLVAMADAVKVSIEKNQPKERQVPLILAHAIAGHPIDPLSAADLINALAHAHDVVMAGEVATRT